MDSATKRKPNILLVLADQLRWDGLGCYGNQIIQTPNLDRLAARGTRFADAMITQPTCTPSRASILTGCYASAIKSRMVGCETPDDDRFMARVLGANGYRSASIGKIHLIPQADEARLVREALETGEDLDYYGFREVELVNGHGARNIGPAYSKRLAELHPDHEELYAEKAFYPDGISGNKAGTHEWPFAPEIHSSNYIADRAIEFLQDDNESPFFLHLSFPDPHHPFTVPEPWASMYPPEEMPPPVERADADSMPEWYSRVYSGGASERTSGGSHSDAITGLPPYPYNELTRRDWARVKSLYYGMISCLDHHVGRVLDELDRLGKTDETLVVFTSDHGDFLGDHGFVGKGYPFDSSLHVPLIAAGPGLAAGQICEHPASTLDIAPTLYELAGVHEPVGLHGVSQAAYLRGESAYTRTTAMIENDDDFAGEKLRTLVTREWKLTYYTGRDHGELYHRTSDPQERNNVWADPAHRDVRDALEREILEEVLCGLDIVPPRVQNPAPSPKKWVPRAWSGDDPVGNEHRARGT